MGVWVSLTIEQFDAFEERVRTRLTPCPATTTYTNSLTHSHSNTTHLRQYKADQTLLLYRLDNQLASCLPPPHPYALFLTQPIATALMASSPAGMNIASSFAGDIDDDNRTIRGADEAEEDT